MKKLAIAMAKCTMQLVDENRNHARIDNLVLPAPSDGVHAKMMRNQESDYAKEGKAAMAKAEEDNNDYRGRPRGKKARCVGPCSICTFISTTPAAGDNGTVVCVGNCIAGYQTCLYIRKACKY
eukprot:4790243-Pyramimonas_sp.AAC.1